MEEEGFESDRDRGLAPSVRERQGFALALEHLAGATPGLLISLVRTLVVFIALVAFIVAAAAVVLVSLSLSLPSPVSS